jgi:hypothetical protein
MEVFFATAGFPDGLGAGDADSVGAGAGVS